ncbi:hypothetical protein ZWY2020_038071 [Hordeum vulgare]|nr:hypothetical protein ZWY2020_038071 [Hordeum vulgare]
MERSAGEADGGGGLQSPRLAGALPAAGSCWEEEGEAEGLLGLEAWWRERCTASSTDSTGSSSSSGSDDRVRLRHSRRKYAAPSTSSSSALKVRKDRKPRHKRRRKDVAPSTSSSSALKVRKDRKPRHKRRRRERRRSRSDDDDYRRASPSLPPLRV